MAYRAPHGPGLSTSLPSALGLGAVTAVLVLAATLMKGSPVSAAVLSAVGVGAVIFLVLYGYGRLTGKKSTGEGLPSADEYWDQQYKKNDPNR